MIVEKIAELEKLIDVPNVDKQPQESLKAMQMLNLIVEIRGIVSELEKPTPTLEQSDDKRLLFSAYLQGKRDQIYWATKWEELKPIGKYRIMKQFLAWYKTLKLKEETK